MSISISCTATIPTFRSASSSTRWMPRSGQGAFAARSAVPTGRANEWTKRSPMPNAPARRDQACCPTTSRWPRWFNPFGPAASLRPDAEWKTWLADRKVTNFAWSSQARGFFTDRAGRGKFSDPELAPCLVLRDATSRAGIAPKSLGKRLGKDPIQVALAYVLRQPWPVIPLIGPRSLAELKHSLSAFEIPLSAEKVRWLENG